MIVTAWQMLYVQISFILHIHTRIFNSRKVSFKSNVVPTRLYAILDTAIDLVLAYKITSSLQHITVISCKREVS